MKMKMAVFWLVESCGLVEDVTLMMAVASLEDATTPKAVAVFAVSIHHRSSSFHRLLVICRAVATFDRLA